MKNRVKKSVGEHKRNQFYKLPKFLILDPEFKEMSAKSKLAYAILLDRYRLSVKNGWIDEKGEIYLIMRRAELQELVGVSKNIATGVMSELKRFRLLEEKRRGQGLPNLIYLLMPENPNFKGFGDDFRIPQGKGQESIHQRDESHRANSARLHPSGFASYNKTESNKTEVSQSVSTDGRTDGNKPTEYLEHEKTVKENIGYDEFARGDEVKMVDNFVDIIVDVLATPGGTVRVDKEDKPRELVKSAYLKLRHGDIEIALLKYSRVYSRIKRTKEYIRTLLYNQAMEGEAHLENFVNSYRSGGAG